MRIIVKNSGRENENRGIYSTPYIAKKNKTTTADDDYHYYYYYYYWGYNIPCRRLFAGIWCIAYTRVYDMYISIYIYRERERETVRKGWWWWETGGQKDTHARIYIMYGLGGGDRGKTAARGINREVGSAGVAVVRLLAGGAWRRACVPPPQNLTARAGRFPHAPTRRVSRPASCAVGYLASAPVRSTTDSEVAAAGSADTRVHTRRRRRRRRRTGRRLTYFYTCDGPRTAHGIHVQCRFSSKPRYTRSRKIYQTRRSQPVAITTARDTTHTPPPIPASIPRYDDNNIRTT